MWSTIARKAIEWHEPFHTLFCRTKYSYEWFVGGELNITHNCLDRHVRDGQGDKTAYIWMNEEGDTRSISYEDLLREVTRFSALLKTQGVKKNDIVSIYMPLSIELVVSMLACARIGAVHSVVYAGFSETALATRIQDAQSSVLITASHTIRRGKRIELLHIARQAVAKCPSIQKVLVDKRNKKISLQENEINWGTKTETKAEIEWVGSEHPLFILYTSGTTGKPKGIVHTHGGYSVYTHFTMKHTFDVKKNDIYWCTADCGWITGHSYVVYGPLSNGVTSLLVEGAPDYPNPDRWFKIISQYKVTIFYTAPTAIRLLKQYGNEQVERHDLRSLRILGTVGEPISPETKRWYHEIVGHCRAPIVDTWWQTETGGHMLVSGVPVPGIEPVIVNEKGVKVKKGEKGLLCIKNPWPAALRTCFNDERRFREYWETIPGNMYLTGDFAREQADGTIQVLGRSDDVIQVSGHRIGTAELESVLVSHPGIVEAAVIGVPDDIKGEKIIAFVKTSRACQEEIQNFVRTTYGAFGVPKEIQIVQSLPKTRSGKIMRRLLKARYLGMPEGDISTLEE